MTESDLMRLIRIEASKRGSRLFRNNVGQAWIGRVERTTSSKLITLSKEDVVLRNARPFHAGLTKGSSDLIGWTSKQINTGSGPQDLALFTAVEVKKPRGKLSAEQENFLSVVRQQGGLAIVARSLEDLDQLYV